MSVESEYLAKAKTFIQEKPGLVEQRKPWLAAFSEDVPEMFVCKVEKPGLPVFIVILEVKPDLGREQLILIHLGQYGDNTPSNDEIVELLGLPNVESNDLFSRQFANNLLIMKRKELEIRGNVDVSQLDHIDSAMLMARTLSDRYDWMLTPIFIPHNVFGVVPAVEAV